MAGITRRQAMGRGAAGALAAVPAGVAVAAAGSAPRFLHGVASGDPAPDGAVLWTRATPPDGSEAAVPLTWHVAESANGRPVRSGRVDARSARDFTAKAVATGLEPGREYHYHFEGSGGARSPAGRFRTLPRGPAPDAVFGVVSCQLYPGGLWNAYDALAREPRLDAVLHLGDYIYEYGDEGYGADIGRQLNRMPEPAHEIVSLADYRARHAQVKRDPDMQAAHARAAFICVWDDHEVANDDWTGGAQNHQPETEGAFAKRKAAAMQAYFEWMPIRDPAPGRPWDAINRSFEWGDLLTLVMVETRLLARSEQVAAKGAAPAPDEYAPMMAERARPDRELLGRGQQDWVEARLAASVKAGKPWQVLGNQVVMARVPGPDLSVAPWSAVFEKLTPAQAERFRGALASYKAGLPFNFDSWDGYPAARERLYTAFRRAGSRPVVLSGDSHAAWANDLHDDAGTLVAAEFGTTAVSSPSYGSILPGVGAAIEAAAPEVRWCDQDRKGYLLLTLDRTAARAEFKVVSTVLAKPYSLETAATWTCAAGTPAPLRRA